MRLMMRIALALLIALAFSIPGTAQSQANAVTAAPASSQAPGDTFAWHGELVSVDQATGTFTVKARMLADPAKEVARFQVGDRVVLTWSGVDKYADAIRQIAKHDTNQKVTDPFALSVELASRDVQNEYVTFKFRAPNAVGSVSSVKPGEWVTVTTKKGSTNDAQAIVSVEPYNKPAPSTS
jgi:hypothetical protein